MDFLPQPGKAETLPRPCSGDRIIRVFTKGAANHVFHTCFQGGGFVTGDVGQIFYPHRDRQIVTGFRHGETLHIITVAVMALRGDVVVNRRDKRIGGDAGVKQQVGIRRTGTARRVVFEKKIRSMLSPATPAIIDRYTASVW